MNRKLRVFEENFEISNSNIIKIVGLVSLVKLWTDLQHFKIIILSNHPPVLTSSYNLKLSFIKLHKKLFQSCPKHHENFIIPNAPQPSSCSSIYNSTLFHTFLRCSRKEKKWKVDDSNQWWVNRKERNDLKVMKDFFCEEILIISFLTEKKKLRNSKISRLKSFLLLMKKNLFGFCGAIIEKKKKVFLRNRNSIMRLLKKSLGSELMNYF